MERKQQQRGADTPFARFILSSLPAWGLSMIVAAVLHRVAPAAGWTLTLMIVVWIAAGLATFPRQRRFFTDDPATRRIVGEIGVAASDLSPHGVVRVHGELWQAHAAHPSQVIAKNSPLRVSDIDGLSLTVEPLDVAINKGE